MMRRWVTPGLIGAALLAALAPVPALAQQAGVAMTAESGGTQAGCVQWSYETVARPGHKAPDRVVLRFTFVNRCDREISVMLYHQSADLAQSALDGAAVVVAPGKSYGGPGKTNYISFSPQVHRYLKFWVIESDQHFSYRNNNILDMNRCNPNFRPTSNTKRTYPPCPPANSYR